jgi:hypothetical protein
MTMDTTMELDDFKSAWRTLDERLARHERINLELLRERKKETARRGLRPLAWGQALQFLLGIGLILLGVACWTRNTEITGLLATGIALHAFGVLTAVMAALTLALMASIDYAAPVLTIQKQMARLLRFYTLNAYLCGLPWWIMWVLVVVGFAGLGEVDPAAPTPAWISISLGIGLCGLLVTWLWSVWHGRRTTDDPHRACHDGGDSIRRGRRLLDDIARFEQE